MMAFRRGASVSYVGKINAHISSHEIDIFGISVKCNSGECAVFFSLREGGRKLVYRRLIDTRYCGNTKRQNPYVHIIFPGDERGQVYDMSLHWCLQ